MSKIKKHSLMLLMMMLIFILIPMSFAVDIADNNATGVVGISDATDNLESTNSINELSVYESNIGNVEGSSNGDVLSANYDYESTVTPNEVSYSRGETYEVTVNIKCDDLSSFSSAPMYVYINGDGVNNRQVVNNVYGNKESFSYDLSKISDKLIDGENTLKFHIDESYLQDNWLTEYQYNPLIVTIGGTAAEPYTGIIYVNESGSDDNDGSEESPVATIAKAIELATSDSNTEHKIIINEGSYTLSNAQLNSDLNITGKGRVIVAPESGKYHVYLGGNNNYEFNNIIFVNGTQSTSAISMSTSANKKVKINNCSFINNTGYSYIICSYGKVTISNCNFINNTVKAGSSAGVIYAYSGSLDVSYSNFINNKNTGSSGYSDVSGYTTGSGYDISYQATISTENNYWGSNNGPSTSQCDKDNFDIKKYVKLTATINAEKVLTGNTYDITLKFTDKSGNDLTENMPDLNVDVNALGNIDKNTATISKNIAALSYTAGEIGEDTFTVKINDISVVTLPITVESDKYTGTIYVGGESSSDDNAGSQTAPVATISKAIELATSEDNEVHEIIINAGNYKEYNLNIASSLTITGNGNVVIDADKKGRIFKITDGDVKLNGLTLTNGVAPADYSEWGEMYAYGGALFVSGNIEIDNVKFVNNTATVYGGAIYWNGKNILVNNSEFVNNTAFDSSSWPESTGGGALYLTGENAKLIKSSFVNNSADYGGAIYIVNKQESSGNIIVNNTFSENSAKYGGAIRTKTDDYAYPDNYIDINNNTFDKNIATEDGGAISNKAYTRVINNEFKSNAASMGGAISNYDEIGIRENTMDSNQATSKANDIYNEGSILSTLTVTFNNGETTSIDDGKGTTLTVKVTDDNGNLITGGEVTFKVQDVEVGTVSIVEGVASIDYVPHENGTLKVSGTYNSDYLNVIDGNLEVSNAREEYFGIIYVDLNGDDGDDGSSSYPVKSIEKAIELATNEKGSNKIIIRAGTYNVTGYSLKSSINITGEGNPILDAQNNNAIFTLTGNGDTTFVLSGLTFANGFAHQVKYGDNEYGGAIYIKGGNLYLENDKFINNTASNGAGAIYVAQGTMDYNTYKNTPTNVVINKSEFENNGDGKNYGGAIFASGASTNVEIIDSTFTKNTAGSGGAIYTYSADISVINSKFKENNASGDGGAIYVSGASATIKNNEFSQNNANGYSGSIYLYKSYNNNIILESNTVSGSDSEIYTNNLNIKGLVINILDGEKQTFTEGEITLYATVNDDNGNKISSNSFTFVINTTSKTTTLDNGEANLVYKVSLSDNGSKVTTSITSSSDGVEVNSGSLEIIEYEVIFDFTDEITAHAGKTLHINIDVKDSAGKSIRDKINVTFNNKEFEVEIGEDDDYYEVVLEIPETPQTLELKVAYGEFNETHTVNIVSYYDGVIYVSQNGDDDNNGSENAPIKTIEKAIELASDDDNTAHKIIVFEGTYEENDLSISNPLEIVAQGNVIIDAKKEGRIFDIYANTNVSGITFKNGKAEDGGAISIHDAKVSIDNSLFINNEASSYGSTIYWDANDGVLTNTVFTNNTARNGVVALGVFNWGSGSTGKNTLVENCTFDNNHNVAYGNCIGLDVQGSDVKIKNTNFTNNMGESGSEHGALYIKGDNVVVDYCLFENNSMGMAAAMQIDGENAKISNSKFINNTVHNGLNTRSGAIEVQNAAEISKNTFINNGGDDCTAGGAINIVYAEYGGEIIISDNEFINNSAKKGGAIYVDGGSEDGCQFDSLDISSNKFENNIAESGSGVYVDNSEGTISIGDNEFKTSDGAASPIEINEYVYTVEKSGNNFEIVYSADDVLDIPSTSNASSTPSFSINLPKDATGNLTVSVNGENYTIELINGSATVEISDLAAGNYNATISYSGDNKYSPIIKTTSITVAESNKPSNTNTTKSDKTTPKTKVTKKQATKIVAKKKTFKAKKKIKKYTITLKTKAGKAVKKVKVTLKIKGKTYKATTNSKGKATFKIKKLTKKGKYTAKIKFAGNKNFKASNKKIKIKVKK